MRFNLCPVPALLALAGRSAADCLSYGYDFVNQGGPYCINTTSTAYFSFGTEFFGCQPSDVQDAVTPILVDPNSDEYFCSDIAVQPDGEDMVSTWYFIVLHGQVCFLTATSNVPGNEVTKNNMFSGDWTIVIEGLTFAWMRSFSIIAAPPVVVTTTPTATFTVTSTPSTTITTTITNVFSTTASPSTVTVPTTTTTRTITTSPAQVTVYSTSTITRTRTSRVFSKTVSTTTVTTSCRTQPPAKDPTCTIRPTKATLAAANASITILPRMRQFERPGRNGNRRANERRDDTPIDSGPGTLQLKFVSATTALTASVDQCTTTVADTANAISSYTTVTAPTSTEIDTENATTTTTV
ncbi:uncharacterized protein A1O5_03864 [Cladophialophora psammophila CBS 110553]|uniref:Ig-like domain-containing protein n=1 Tax=Cladophialophora psammophila CBS 110553 TaxID=1182543 RepID=W9WWY3_9EURO|nr:uncharacterized protein A1O5_03864 [Cladophialophora psammophila CBS 110553]EXJ72717.1 hypothetical protein A1O5_03864 [Cladophialophora psammophila CBS 110553]